MPLWDSSLNCTCSALSHSSSTSTFQSYRMDDEPDRLSNRLLEYDPNTNKWTELGPMKYSKYRCGAVVLNGEIFVIGQILFLSETSAFEFKPRIMPT